MKYQIGDRVRIKSLDWYNENNDEDGVVPCGDYDFVFEMSVFCGKILTIDNDFEDETYLMKEDNDGFVFTNEMIEGLVEEENKPKFKVGDEVRIKGTDIGGTIESVIRGQLIVNSKGSKIPVWPEDVVLIKSVEEETKPNIIKEAKTYWDSIKDAWICPEGYIFKDENGNEILTSKIILEKKKKEYPKTYEECCRVLGVSEFEYNHTGTKVWYRHRLMATLDKLMLCRDAYWKIAGDWKPEYPFNTARYVITNRGFVGKVLVYDAARNYILEFPTEEMRDTFYENFKEFINECKELL